ncbi:MAG TPA: tetratricopeptide repeat protein [Thermoanaerobaculia bacterium]|nr:tetratricopeptide repeat protein [Thermoanaerobaculia bacterium]
MSADHLKVKDFERFLRNATATGTAPRNTRLVRHLLAACAPCQENLRTAASSSPEAYDYGTSFADAEQSLAAFLAKDRTSEVSAEDLLAELTQLPPAVQVERVVSGRYAVPSFVKYLIDASHGVRYQDPARMLHFANLARLAAQACPVEAVGSEPRQADLRAQAWRQYGNSLRVLGHLGEAEEAISVARRHLEEGTRDPLLRARFCTQAVSLRLAQRQFDKAIELAEEAGQIYTDLEDDHAFASTLVQKAIACLYAGEGEESVQILNRAIPLIEAERDPNLLLSACHNLVRSYIELGRPEQALSLYSETRDLYRRSKDPLLKLRLAWQEGLLLRDLGHLRASETILLDARQGFVDRELFYEAALISLDLAAVYVKLQAESQLKQTVAETVPIFRSLGVERELLGSLLQLQQPPHQNRQTLALLQVLSSQIEQLPARSVVY